MHPKYIKAFDTSDGSSDSEPSVDLDTDSDSGSEQGEGAVLSKSVREDEGDDGDDDGEAAKPQGYVRTPHEVTEVKITVPDILEVSPDEALEKVGEVMTVLPDTVVVKGIPAPIIGRASEKALDSDTLLILGDRRVLGFVRVLSCDSASLNLTFT